ncbi:MAG: phosphoribosyl-AMP cyclohydrolase [Rhizobiales bacterium]|nr:phosphoribosyl-AMP cyclohydrolase [Hyphomicrobiales bacterium]
MVFQTLQDSHEIEAGDTFAPRFDAKGLVPVVTTSAEDGRVLMLAYMNAEALARTIETGIATYWSRSRGKLWVKGETSGNVQHVVELRTDCDQDAIWIVVRTAGAGVACHTGAASCFYRAIAVGSGPAAGTRRLEPRDQVPGPFKNS